MLLLPLRHRFHQRATYALIAINLYLGLWIGRFRLIRGIPWPVTLLLLAAALGATIHYRRRAHPLWITIAASAMIASGVAGGLLVRLLLHSYSPPVGHHGGAISYGFIGMFSFLFVWLGALWIGMKGLQAAQGNRSAAEEIRHAELEERLSQQESRDEPGRSQ